MQRKRLIIFLLILYILLPLSEYAAQDTIRFINKTDLLEKQTSGGPLCMAFADLNGDYRDDIVRFKNWGILQFDISINNGEYFRNTKVAKLDNDGWTISVGDLDNDGIAEILTAGASNPLSIWHSDNTAVSYDSTQFLRENFFAQASNLVDINNDGWLDAFVCNDIGLSKVYLNDGTGKLIEDPELIDMQTEIPSDNSGNYGSEWTDVDGDGDLDLYIAKCKAGVDDFEDPRRINALFVNNGGSFVEAAKEFGIASGAQSWTANLGDIDNDSDMDLFIVNHSFRSQLFENIDNDTFVEIDILEDGSELTNYGFQSAMYDFNNDGFLDILIGGGDDMLLLNTGNNKFQIVQDLFGEGSGIPNNIWSFAISDSNLDGFGDLISTYNPLANPGNYLHDSLWFCLPNENNYLGLALEGVVSNRSAVGARVEIYGNWGVQSRIIKAGSGYGINNSLKVNFGLGDHEQIDSLKIKWPSGIVDLYKDISSNQYYLAVEGSCLEQFINIESDYSFLDCMQDSTELRSSEGLVLQWPDGSESISSLVSEEGYVMAFNAVSDNCRIPSQNIWIESLDLPAKPVLSVLDSIVSCEIYGYDLEVFNYDSVYWSTGSFSNIISLVEEGSYFAYNFNYCDTVYSDIVQLSLAELEDPSLNDTIHIDSAQALSLIVDKGSVRWFKDPNGNELIDTGSVLLTTTLESDSCFYFDYELKSRSVNYRLGENIDILDTLDYRNIFFNDGLHFSVFDSLNLKSVKVYSLKKGLRSIQLLDENTSVLQEKSIYLGKGLHKIDLDFSMSAGNYILSTDQETNINELGLDSPFLLISENSTEYPYQIKGLISINNSSFINSFYPYFFNWELEHFPQDCRSDIHKISIDLDSISSNTQLSYDDLKVFPNPFEESFTVNSAEKVQEYQLFSSDGKPMRSLKIENSRFDIDTSDLDPGIYFLRLKSRKRIYSFKLLKI